MRQLTMQRGDTIIEVMVAFAVFAMVAVGAMTVMNQGTAKAQDTLETTQVRQQIDNQAEMLRYMHQSYLANSNDATEGSLPSIFREILSQANAARLAGATGPSTFGAACTDTIPAEGNRFTLNPSTGAQIPAGNIRAVNHPESSVYARTVSVGPEVYAYGLWVEPIISNAAASGGTGQYIDFHIRACWYGASSGPQRTLGTIVRLYVP